MCAKPVNVSNQAQEFSNLHHRDGPFVIPNPWDVGSAVMLAGLGYRALATTSGGLAASLGVLDRAEDVTLEHTLANVEAIAGATTLPVSADFEDGFAVDAAGVGENFARLATTGAVGGSIEDTTGEETAPIRSFADAVERVEAAVAAVRGAGFPFTLTARAENFLYGRPDLDDTIARLKAFAAAGADVVYAPALPDADAIRRVCAEVDAPVNVLLGVGNSLSVRELFQAGATRVSLGSALSRAAYGAFVKAAREVLEAGTCDFTTESLSMADMRKLLG
ncbi:isocitrate lyase/PEP mutase family protein [Natronoglycomyces albus]|uniref:Isocitrate lyase/phosphoenolpyruvate mutase family protein n=1 Tax=Natronoglycomyces albus TaxID=2811108 RepID=A0A895XJ42_9ACTN|nr:isocitrate lyase/phosphoenolpyruvate mutase family protein [Natronoglycomyces albus]QSB03842.1 isocitrate lyase/phosphoenolpyruvate mutase family protein [Natronoglycomyces albus]